MRINSSGALSGTSWCLCRASMPKLGHEHWVWGRQREEDEGWNLAAQDLRSRRPGSFSGGKLPGSALNLVCSTSAKVPNVSSP